MWTNFHTHSNYCDGKSPLAEIVHSAEGRHMVSLGFSSHAPIPFDCKWCMKAGALENYLYEIKELKKSSALEIYAGLEVDYIPTVTSPKKFELQLDYTIGSVHFADAFADGKRWEIDGPHEGFLKGLEAIFKNDIQATYTRYFELTREMIATAPPTIVGHIDKVKIHNIGEKFFKESDPWYQREVKKTLDLVQESGIIVEVNTRGLYLKKSLSPYPSPWVLELILQKNIPITINSDAHHPDDLTNQFYETAMLLGKIGFKKITALKEGKWRQFDFNENGIVIDHH